VSDLARLPLRQVVRAFDRGELDPAEYLESFLTTISRRDDEINAFIHCDPDAVRRERGGRRRGALASIPVAIKDNITVTGAPTTCGSKILRDFVSPYDATAVARLRAEGALIVGKTNLDEFAMGSSTEHSAFGPTRNPLDPDRVPGGSSGGSAAAVAAGMVPIALGSETGGSVRQPAAFCGLVGLKPTYGRVSRSGLVAFASSLDQIGIFSRSVEDAALLLGVIAGHDPADSTSSRETVGDYLSELEGGAAGLTIGVVDEAIEQAGDEARENLERTLESFRRDGARIERVSIPSIGLAIAIYYVVANAEASANLSRFDGVRYGARAEGADTLDAMYARTRSEGFGTEVKRRIMLGTFALSSGYYDAYYGRAQQFRQAMRGEFARAFEKVDLLAGPTTPGAAFRLGEKASDPLQMYLSDIFTAPANLVGVPAIAVPAGKDRDGMPLSIQLMGSHFSEELLLRAARSVESAQPA
jgi:aspartyl-tRNA(Asn)/glutamyl-tRNA(Gln) amidotransferase subunit A